MAAFLVSDCFGGEDKSATLIFWQQNVKHWKSKTIKFIPRRWFLNPFEQICSSNWIISPGMSKIRRIFAWDGPRRILNNIFCICFAYFLGMALLWPKDSSKSKDEKYLKPPPSNRSLS